jgi:hypothetical protein
MTGLPASIITISAMLAACLAVWFFMLSLLHMGQTGDKKQVVACNY